ncbi:hypothetical protein [Enterococcus xiangfangensis]|uniref:aldose epimerase family protein n=1 Tax=Enterococcus xiangfangensis TaxID=1296537 RepID=UPI0010F551E7|nr:hypothetical protein [Enterococcus xiangfangensis]MBM7712354.1 aldose 1-epimerase [Enterococcus xiangfangensis]
MFQLSYDHIDKSVIFTKVSIKKELEVTFSNLGASIFNISFSDNRSNLENILVAPPKDIWLNNKTFAGSIVGPLAGRYEVGKTTLERNRPPIHFHGGSNGWDKLIWKQSVTENNDSITISFCHSTSDYVASVIYSIDSGYNLIMEILVNPTAETYLNPTNHMYFNLNGSAFQPITNHLFQINSDLLFHEKNGLIQSTVPFPVPSQLNFQSLNDLSTLANFEGINHTYQLHNEQAGILRHPTNGRQITFTTTLPSVVIYTFNTTQETFASDHQLYPIYSGITFETQYPANQLERVTFGPKKPYHSKTTYNFSIIGGGK